MDTRTTIGRLRVRAALDPLTARPGVERALRGADLRPSGLGPATILVVRSLPDPLPGGLDLHAAVPAAGAARWSGALRAALAARLAEAARPALAPPAANATAVLFADRAELLACLVRDRGAGDRWWWRALRGPGGPVVHALLERPQDVPAAVARLAAWGLAERFATELNPADAAALRRAVAEVFGVTAGPRGGAGPGRAGSGEPGGAGPGNERSGGPGPGGAGSGGARPGRAGSARSTPTAYAAPAPSDGVTIPGARDPKGPAAPRTRPGAGAPPDGPGAAGRRNPDRWPVGADASRDPRGRPAGDAGPSGAADRPMRTGPPGVRLPGAVERRPGHRPADDRRTDHHPAGPRAASAVTPAPAPPDPEAQALLDLCRALHPGASVDGSAALDRPVRTDLGGLLHLVHVAQGLGLYAGAADPGRPNLRLPVWDLVALLGAALLPRRWRRDPVWPLLAALAARPLDRPPGIGFRPPRGRTWVVQARPPSGATARDRWVACLADHVRDRLALATGVPRHRAPALVLVRPALVHVTATDVDVVSELADLPIEVRLAGLDRDPGFVPAAGRRLRFHFR